MIYRAIRNFRIARLIVTIGEIYQGDDVDHLLKSNLIEAVPEVELSLPSEAETKEITDDQSPSASEDFTAEETQPTSKKSKKKKE